MTECPCCSDLAYESCCEPFLESQENPPTAIALMRSRYTAYVKGKLDYLQRTMHRSTRDKFDEASAGSWSKQSEWLGLEILSTAAGNPEDSVGKVEFVARYKKDDKEENHHEIAHFKRDQEKWYFVDGKLQGAETFVRAAPKVGRNEPCPCGSGKKYKKCCG